MIFNQIKHFTIYFYWVYVASSILTFSIGVYTLFYLLKWGRKKNQAVIGHLQQY